jgi:hypothetical protein
MTRVAALVLLAATGSKVELVRVAVLVMVPTLPWTWASMTKVTETPAGTAAARGGAGVLVPRR